MSNFSSSTFINPLTSTDTLIKILDESLQVKWTINPFTIRNIYISNNLIKINLYSDRIITLDFNSSNDAKIALPRLKQQVDELMNKRPIRIEKSIDEFYGPLKITENKLYIGTSQSIVATASTASGTASYIEINLNGVDYKIPIYKP